MILPLLLAGCGGGGDTLDASSDESLEASTSTMGGTFEPTKRAKFDRAVSASIFEYGDVPPADAAKTRQELFGGKTADQIIAAARFRMICCRL